jgi:hypothetical protein
MGWGEMVRIWHRISTSTLVRVMGVPLVALGLPGVYPPIAAGKEACAHPRSSLLDWKWLTESSLKIDLV